MYARNGIYWNEQYLLQAFLAFNEHFEMIWPGNWLMVHHTEKMRAAFPRFDRMRQLYPYSEPTSFWMRVTDVVKPGALGGKSRSL